MALTWSSSQDNSSYGNINMRIWIGRGSCTRTATSVSFDFGVCFMPISNWTTNSIAAYYGGVAKYANVTRSSSSKSKATESTYHYAYYSNRNSTGRCTTETTCFSYSNSSINANTTSVSVTIGVGWADWAGTYKGDLTFSLAIPKYIGVGTGPSELAIGQTAGVNSVTFSGKRGINGTNNEITAGTLYYKVGAEAWQSESLGTTSDGSYTKTISNLMTSARDGKTVSAYVTYTFENGDTLYNYSSSYPNTRTCYYYSAGGTPKCTISQSVGSNTVTISGSRGANGSHNGKTASKLYYNLGKGGSNVEVNLGTTGSDSYTKTLTMDSSNNNKTISAYVWTDYTYGDDKYGYATSITSKYYSSVEPGTVTITDNGNNTFTLKGTKGSDGYNNVATGPTLSWGYDTNYSNSFKTGDTKDLTIATPANATRTVYAKSVTGKTNYGSAKTATTSLAVKQYVVPNSPSNISLTYKKSRLTIREDWTLKWTGSTKSNDSSPVAGYRIRVWKNGVTIPFKDSSGNIKTNTPASTDTHANRYYYDRDLTSTEMVIDPVTNDFLPGDEIHFTIHSYIKNGKGERKFSTSYATSTPYIVQNAGIARVKVGGSWKEGQVWIKTGGAWKEAVSVHAKVSGSWKEST